MNKDQLLRDFEALLSFPDVAKSFSHKIEELKILFGQDIARLRDIKKMIQLENTESVLPGVNTFKLFKHGHSWRPVDRKGIPSFLVKVVLELSQKEPSRLSQLVHTPYGSFQISFIKDREDFITGSFKRLEAKPDSTAGEGNVLTGQVESEIREIISYMLQYPELRRNIHKQVQLKWNSFSGSEGVNAE